jgi:hypothetical protein
MATLPLLRGRPAHWTKEKIDLLSTADVRNLRANAERLQEPEVAALCVEVLATRPRSGVPAPAKPKAKRRAPKAAAEAEATAEPESEAAA